MCVHVKFDSAFPLKGPDHLCWKAAHIVGREHNAMPVHPSHVVQSAQQLPKYTRIPARRLHGKQFTPTC